MMRCNKKFILYIVVLIVLVIACGNNTEKRKIKLSATKETTDQNNQLTSTIYLEPTLRRTVAVMFFENKTGDQNLEWLQKGLTEMFIRSLSQSQNLSVLSSERVNEILDRLGKTDVSQEIDMDMAAIVAKEANVEALLTGNISKDGDGIQINVKVHEAEKGEILKEESVEGQGLENLFGMVDNLTQKIKNELKLSLEKDGAKKSIADISTTSLEAWKNYINGINFAEQFRLPEAKEQFEKAIELDSTFIAAYLKLVPLFYGLVEQQKGLQAFRKLVTYRENATPQEKYQIDLLTAGLKGDPRKTMEVSQKWLEQYPNDRDANLSLANIYFNLKNFDLAIKYYKNVLTIDPNYKIAYNLLGYAYANIGQFSKAISSLENYQQLSPDEANPYDSLGEIYLYLGDFDKAEKKFKQAARVNENFIYPWIHLGETCFDNGKFNRALEYYQKAIGMAEDNANLATMYRAIGLAQLRLGRSNEAASSILKSMEYPTNLYSSFTILNDIYLSMNDTMRAHENREAIYSILQKSVHTTPIRLVDMANMSLWYNYKIEESIEVIEQTLEHSTNDFANMWGRFLIALLYLKSNQYKKFEIVSDDFAHEFIEIIKDIRDIRYNYYTWKGYLVFNEYAYQFKEVGITKYNQLINFCKENNMNMPEMVFRSFLADLYFNTGEIEKAERELKIAGVPAENKWMLIGPFENKNGFTKKFPPEKKIDLDKTYKRKSVQLRWQQAADGFQEGYLNFRQIFKNSNWGVSYALVFIKSPGEKTAQIRLGSNESVKVWLNNNEVWRWNEPRNSIFDDDVIPVSLQSGWNKVLIKICNRIGEWGFYFRVTDEQGNGIPDIEFISPLEVKNN